MDDAATREEADAAGSEIVPAERLWGPQTARALRLFPDGPKIPCEVIHAFGHQKAAAARANLALGRLSEDCAGAIVAAAEALAAGRYDDEFPLSIWQTGSGTQTNMTANEVVANAANRALGRPLGARSPVHPNDHVNLGQSSNDSFPTVMQVAALTLVEARLLPALDALSEAIARRTQEIGGVVRLGRTHLNDAVPLFLSATLDAWEETTRESRVRIAQTLPDLRRLPQGGTAAGSGLNAPPAFAQTFCSELSHRTGLDLSPARSKLLGMSGHDGLVALSGQIAGAGLGLKRIADDIRHLSSGPRAGLAELLLPDDGLSSSIMPGKRNAVECEVVVQIYALLIGCDATVRSAAATSVFELNVAKPVLIASLIDGIRALTGAATTLANVVAGLQPDRDRMRRNVTGSLMLATALTPELGYEAVARLVRIAQETGSDLRSVVADQGAMALDRFDALTSPERLAEGGVLSAGSASDKGFRAP